MKCNLCPIDKEPNESVGKRFGVPTCQECLNRINNVDTTPSTKLRKDERTEAMKEDGAKNWSATLQPRRHGKPSKEFINEYPEEAKKMFTKKEILGSKNTWYDEPGAKSSNPNIGGDRSSINPKALE